MRGGWGGWIEEEVSHGGLGDNGEGKGELLEVCGWWWNGWRLLLCGMLEFSACYVLAT
jgi:hypothetical protein